MTSLFLKSSAENNFTKYLQDSFYHPTKTLHVTFLSFFSFFKDRFCCEMAKQRSFLRVVSLSFNLRFMKYFNSVHYHKHFPINDIKVKCLQIGQNVSDIF